MFGGGWEWRCLIRGMEDGREEDMLFIVFIFCVICRPTLWGWGCFVWYVFKLQALVYDIIPPTTAIIGYAIGLQKL